MSRELHDVPRIRVWVFMLLSLLSFFFHNFLIQLKIVILITYENLAFIKFILDFFNGHKLMDIIRFNQIVEVIFLSLSIFDLLKPLLYNAQVHVKQRFQRFFQLDVTFLYLLFLITIHVLLQTQL